MEKTTKKYVCVLMKTIAGTMVEKGNVYDGMFHYSIYDAADSERKHVVRGFDSENRTEVAKVLIDSDLREEIKEVTTLPKKEEYNHCTGVPIDKIEFYNFISECLYEMDRQKAVPK